MTNFEKAQLAIERYANGQPIGEALSDVGLARSTFSDLRHRHPSLEVGHQRARETTADRLADEIVTIADTEEDPNKARIRVDARKWAAGVLNRAVYGDKTDITLNKGVDLGSVLTEVQRRRLRLDSDSDQIEEAQVIETQALPSPSTADTESEPIDNPFED